MNTEGPDPKDDKVVERGTASASTPSEELMRRFQQGDAEALEQLWQRYLPRLRKWAHGRLPSFARGETNTDDLVQDTFVRSFQHLQTLELRGQSQSLFAYFRTILFNQVRDQARRAPHLAKREVLETDAHVAQDASPLEQLVGREAVEEYEAALATLSTSDQEIVLAVVELRLDDQELAELFEKPSANAARMARGRALTRLAEAMSLQNKPKDQAKRLSKAEG